MRRVVQTLVVLVLLAGGVLVAAPPAQALLFDLTSNHCSDAAGCGAPGTIFGTVDVEQNGANVDVTVHLNSPYAFAKTGSADNQAFKFNATGVVLGDITVNQTVPGQTLAPQTGAFNGDGTGTFVFGIACVTCGGGLSNGFTNDIVFHVASATIADITAANGNGNVFVADIGNTTNGATGPIDASTPHQNVPEPATIAFLGTGLVALGVALRRRRVQG